MTYRKHGLLWVVLVSLIAITCGTLGAQATAAGRGSEVIKGVVTNEDNIPMTGVKVVLQLKGHYRMSPNTRRVEFVPAGTTSQAIEKEIITKQKGEFRFVALGYGQWEVTATYKDLVPAVRLMILDRTFKPRPITLVMRKHVPLAAAGGVVEDTSVPEAKKIKKNAKKLYELGVQLLEYDELGKAVQCFRMATERKPEWSLPYLKMGYAYFNLGKDEKALENFTKFLELDPKSPEAATVKEMVAILKEE